MYAALTARKGWRAVMGLAVSLRQFVLLSASKKGGVPRSANAVACRVVENMTVACKGVGRRERVESAEANV